jgi:activator of HSP90 ATPase
VQAWRVRDWEPGVFSLVRFAFQEHTAGTLVVFDHVGFPAGQREHLVEGWHANYWDPLRKAVET